MTNKEIDVCDWSKGTPLIGDGWHILGDENYKAMDPVARITPPTADLQELEIDIPKFTLGFKNPADHVKALLTTQESFSVANGFSVAVDISAKIRGTENNPFGADPDDPKLGCGSISIIDGAAGMVINFEVSNTRVITLRELFDSKSPEAIKPFLMCDPHLLEDIRIEPCSWHRYEIQYHPAKDSKTQSPDTVKWLIDGDLVREVEWLPKSSPSSNTVIKPSEFTVNMAMFTLLDDLPDGQGGMIRGYDPEYTNTTFGQGATVKWKNLQIRTAL